MDAVIAVALQSMQVDMQRMDRIAMNLANAQTVGYKRDVAVAVPFAHRVERSAGDAPALATRLDTTPGSLKATGQALDVAFSGPGWFEVSTDQGPAYTRQGSFRPDTQGRLVTAQGHPVQGLGGAIQLPEGKPVIDAIGRVFEGIAGDGSVGRVGGQPLAQLKLVRFAPSAAIQRLGDGLVRITGEAVPLAEGEAELRQGFLENANVSSAHEMVQLMQTVRHFESMQKVALGYDEMLGAAVRKLGESS
jgi:flagellar basal-body rod protein FlgF